MCLGGFWIELFLPQEKIEVRRKIANRWFRKNVCISGFVSSSGIRLVTKLVLFARSEAVLHHGQMHSRMAATPTSAVSSPLTSLPYYFYLCSSSSATAKRHEVRTVCAWLFPLVLFQSRTPSSCFKDDCWKNRLSLKLMKNLCDLLFFLILIFILHNLSFNVCACICFLE